MRNNKHDISGTSYTMTMDEKITRYTNLVRQAERTNYACGGRPTKEEATFYYQAAKICEEIIALNTSQRAVSAQWRMRKQDCEDNVKRITDILAPAPAAPQPQPTAAPVSEERVSVGAAAAIPQQNGLISTKSGFTTRNACRDVPAETIERWFNHTLNHDFDDVSGMEELKQRLSDEAASLGWSRIDRELNINSVQSYFLYGPPGTGKSFIIQAFAAELKKKGFNFMQLMGGEIHASLVGVAEKTIQIAFQEAIDKAPCIIFIDEIENVCVKRGKNAEGHEKRLTVAFLEAYNLLRQCDKRVIFMGATNHPGSVDEAMLDRVKLVKIPLPTEKAREAFFDRAFGNLAMEENFTTADMADLTQDYSYRDMGNLKDVITSKVKAIAIRENTVLDAEGNIDQEASDIQASEAIHNGSIVLSRELFEECRDELVLVDMSEINRELKEFEEARQKF